MAHTWQNLTGHTGLRVGMTVMDGGNAKEPPGTTIALQERLHRKIPGFAPVRVSGDPVK